MIQNNQFIGLRNANNIMKSFQQDELQLPSLDELRKGGEGSKGGKVIGHTKSGKPIYDHFEHEGHKDFTREDHWDAQDHFNKILKRHLQPKNWKKVGSDKSVRKKFVHAREQHEKHMFMTKEARQKHLDKQGKEWNENRLKELKELGLKP